MNIGKLLKSVVRAVKKNPEVALVVVGLVAPGVARKVTPIVLAATKGEDS